MTNIFADFLSSLSLVNLGLAFSGVLAGIIIGALPGLSATMAVAILVPFTFALEPSSGLIVLGAIYTGAIFGGSWSAILINTPGTPSAVATTFDGYPMAKNGDGDLAMSISCMSSFIGGLVGVICLALFAPPLASVSLKFGPTEYFWLAILGLTLISTLAEGDNIKSLIGACIGLLMSMIGVAVVGGDIRMTWNISFLNSGIEIVSAMIGLFCVPVILDLTSMKGKHLSDSETPKNLRLKESFLIIFKKKFEAIRGALIGTFIGILPGAGGSIGSELCKQIHRLKPKLLILLEQNEYNLFKISSQLKENIFPSLTDIKDFSKMEEILRKFKPDYIFHTAALKHITFVETDPIEALHTNFLATVKLCQLCKFLKIKKMVFISTDKAVNPSNIMGASKRLCEKYIQKIASKEKDTLFTIVRFGNVLGSTGSVVPVFEKQISEGGPVKITHPKIRRFFMTIREAVELVLISSQLQISDNGEIFILEMGDPIYIKDLAKKMIILSGADEKNIKIQFTGLRKGEKINEELFFKSEQINKTNIKGILSTTSKLFSPKNSDFDKLVKLITNKRNKNSLEIFEKMLPEYKKE